MATGVCHTDLIARDQLYPVPQPIVLGHEGAGIVEKVGAAIRHVEPGDHVVSQRQIFGQTFTFLDRLARSWGIETTFVTATEPGAIRAALRPEKIMLCEDPPADGFNFAVGEVVHIAYLGDLSIYHVRLKSRQMLSAQLQNEHRYRKGQPTWGDEVRLCWDADSCVVLTV